ncbi:MAG: N-acetylglucosamine-6-phosphate deacetylase [Clostridia bacterium]|nr:N-acetylglucosamine-6-phosphate deacetylase [Clostridia bacterium]
MILKNGNVLCGDFVFRKCDVKIENGLICEIGENLSGGEVLDLGGDYLLPGLIDEHFHGANNCSVYNGNTDEIIKLAEYEASQGVTAITPTLSSYPDDIMFGAIDAVSEAMGKEHNGSEILGIHLEGPFLSHEYRGAHIPENLRIPTAEKMKEYIDRSPKAVKLLTLAPELDEDFATIKYATSRGVTVSIGHSKATYEIATAAIDAGATVSTHTFNAMVPLNHRNPGILGAVLTDDRLSCEVMGDFGHVAPAIVKLIYKAKGPDRVNFVSDSSLIAGLPEGEYIIDGVKSYLKGVLSYVADGTISGSATTVLTGVKNAVKIDIPLEDAVKMASLNPARSLKVDNILGSIEVGKHASMFVAGDDLNPKAVFVKGKRVL